MKKFLSVIAFVLLTASAFGNERGNGGDVVVCKDSQGKITSATILDVYEAKEMHGLELDLGPSDLSLVKKWEILFNRVAKVSPEFSKYLKTEVTLFNQEARFLKDIILNDIPDSDHLYIPRDCQILQIAIQRTPKFPSDHRFVISDDLWRLLNNDNKIALILHEIIYKIAIQNHQANSKNARYFSSLIFSREILRFQGVELASLVAKLKMRNASITYLHKGYEIYGDDYSVGNEKIGGRLVSPRKINLLNNELLVSKIYFYSDGISEVSLPCPTKQSFNYRNRVGAEFCGDIHLNELGNLTAIIPRNDILKPTGMVSINGQKVQFKGELSFDSNERVSRVSVLSPYTHNFFGNTIPLIGRLIFNNGDLDLSPGTRLQIAQDSEVTVGNLSFKLNRADTIKVDGGGRIYFPLAEEVPVKLPPQPEFYCGEKIAFFEDGMLESCENRGQKNRGYTEFNFKDGTSIRYRTYYMVHFDHDGFFR